MWLNPKLKDISGKYVADGIGEEYKEWNCNSFVLISTPTGSGKNTFIMDKLIPHAMSQNKKVMILSNRVALSIQQKKKILDEIYPYPFPIEQIKKMADTGNAIFLSYQSIIRELDNPQNSFRFQNVGYIVLDEAHFFIADAKFNAQTETILSKVITCLSLATRIYMTATPNQVLNSITWYENTYLNNRICSPDTMVAYQANPTKNPPKCYWYTAVSHYENYDFKFFDDWKIITNQIISSDPVKNGLFS